MKKTRLLTFAGAAMCLIIGLVGGASVAHAEEAPDPDDIAAVLAQVPAQYGLLDQGSDSEGAGQADVHRDPSDGITLTSSRGSILEVELPFLESALPGVPVGEALAYDNVNGSTTVPIVKADGSVQVTTVIADATAPTRYEYGFPGATSLVQGERTVAILGASGEFLGGVAAPWAVDAAGAAVPTHFEIAGTTLVQVVDHQSGEFQYPIVADPWLGIDLYYTPNVSFPSGGYAINVVPTVWGGAYSGPEEVYMWWAHRDEVVSKLGSSSWRWTTSIQEQFYCHIAGFPLGLPEYNMESWRPLVYWETSLVLYQCNP